MNIFLMGFMGCGKSTIGKKLAKLIDYDFIDFDRLIEEKVQLSINDIFKQKGERYFRELETDVLNQLNINNTVISLGGGTPCYNENIALINQKGLSIYLKMSKKVLAQRLVESKTKRPLIDDIKNNPVLLNDKINDLLLEREPDYLKADIIFNALNMNAKKYDLLLKQIENYFMSF